MTMWKNLNYKINKTKIFYTVFTLDISVYTE